MTSATFSLNMCHVKLDNRIVARLARAIFCKRECFWKTVKYPVCSPPTGPLQHSNGPKDYEKDFRSVVERVLKLDASVFLQSTNAEIVEEWRAFAKRRGAFDSDEKLFQYGMEDLLSLSPPGAQRIGNKNIELQVGDEWFSDWGQTAREDGGKSTPGVILPVMLPNSQMVSHRHGRRLTCKECLASLGFLVFEHELSARSSLLHSPVYRKLRNAGITLPSMRNLLGNGMNIFLWYSWFLYVLSNCRRRTMPAPQLMFCRSCTWVEDDEDDV